MRGAGVRDASGGRGISGGGRVRGGRRSAELLDEPASDRVADLLSSFSRSIAVPECARLNEPNRAGLRPKPDSKSIGCKFSYAPGHGPCSLGLNYTNF
jgi:hypothetical protein